MAADSRGPTNGDGAGSGGARGGDREPTSQGDAKDPGAKVEPRALVTEAKVEILDQGGAGGRKETNGAGGTER